MNENPTQTVPLVPPGTTGSDGRAPEGAGRIAGTARPAVRPAVRPEAGQVLVDIVVPVYNEEADLGRSVLALERFLAELYPPGGPTYRITIADNASTDATASIAARLADGIPQVTYLRLDEKGRGRALRRAWLESDAPILAYMDVDLSTGLAAFPSLVAPLISGHSDVAIGSRLASGARTVRGPKREFISRCYNLILKGSLGAGFSDAQCGFKAIRADVAHLLVPVVEDQAWFFDTELLVLAEQAGLRISEVPVDWVDDADSSVHIAGTALDDLKGVWRVARGLATGRIPLAHVQSELGRDRPPEEPRGFWSHLVRFGTVGVASTLAYLLLFLLLTPPVGGQAANLVALLLTTIGNTAANRWFTFGVRGRAGMVTHHLQGLTVFFVGWALSAGALGLAQLAHAGHAWQLLAVVLGNLAATAVKFVLFRQWIFRDRVAGRSSHTDTEVTP